MPKEEIDEKILLDADGKPIGYELKAIVIDHNDCQATIEIRPERTKSSTVEIFDCRGDWENRPHAQWARWKHGPKLKVLIVNTDIDVILARKEEKK